MCCVSAFCKNCIGNLTEFGHRLQNDIFRGTGRKPSGMPYSGAFLEFAHSCSSSRVRITRPLAGVFVDQLTLAIPPPDAVIPLTT